MTKTEIAKLLTFCAVVDKRTVGEADVEAWFLLLGALDFDRAMTAAVNHYRRSSDYLTPNAIWSQAKTGTDGDAASALERSLEAECPDGSFCRTCKGVHFLDRPCPERTPPKEIAARLRSVTQSVPRRFADAAPRAGERTTEMTPETAAALEAERRRQLDALEAMTEESA